LLISLGISAARNYAKRFGFDDEALPRDLSLALGSGTLSPLRLASGFSVFANEGYRIEPFFIDRIENDEGSILWYADYELACLKCFVESIDSADLQQNYIVEWPVLDAEPEPGAEQAPAEQNSVLSIVDEPSAVQKSPESLPAFENEIFVGEAESETNEEQELPVPKRVLRQAPRIMDGRVNYIMNSILRDVVLRGTGRRALELGRGDIGGKTGTSNDEHDAWFNGFNYKYAASVWVGFDTDQPLGSGEAGSRAALPLWIDYMREALQGVPEKLPEQPEGLATIRIDSQTGLLATTATQESIFEIFRTENVPTEQSEPAVDLPFESETDESGTVTRPGVSVTEELF
jgi:penicillin-binding protein 1A